MKKSLLAGVLASLTLLGAGCSQTPPAKISPFVPTTTSIPDSNTEQTVPTTNTTTRVPAVDVSKQSLKTFLQNYSKATTTYDRSIINSLGPVFSVALRTETCDPNEGEINCCDPETKTFTPQIYFYTEKSTQWQKGGVVQFYLDPASGFCADGGFGVAQGPFKGDLSKLYREAAQQHVLITTTPY